MKSHKRWICLIWAVLICFLAAACGKDPRLKDVGENTLAVKKSGKIEEYLVEKLDKDYYSPEALELYVDQEIGKHEGVSLKNYSTEGDTVRAEIHYDDPSAFEAFNGQKLTLVRLSEASGELIGEASEGSVPDKGYVVVTEFQTRLIGPGDPAAWSEGVTVSEDGICQTTAQRCVIIYK